MNKSERLNDELIFLNGKNSFNLKDLMEKYSISKRTAIRDIQNLESLGMPIYSTFGRNGNYKILQNKLLSPILFNMDEIFALYFSMLTLKAYETTPFHLSVEKLKEKFNKCLSKDTLLKLKKIENIFSLGAVQHNNSCPLLKDILQNILSESVCDIQYNRNNIIKNYSIQFFEISSSFGQWYVSGYSFITNDICVFRCDKIINIKKSLKYESKSINFMKDLSEEFYRNSSSIDFEIIITSKGADIFYKENYPSMKMFFEENQYIIKGFYNKGEEDFISQYILGYGNNIVAIKPKKLKELIINKLDFLKATISLI